MALLELIFGTKTKAQVGLVTFDASLSESHNKSNNVTGFPVEYGSTISDHIMRNPETVNINGMITNHPAVILPALNASSPLANDKSSADDRVGLADAEIRRTMDDGELVSVVTSLREYENMAILDYSVQRDASNGNVLNASLSLQEVILTRTETVDAPPEPEKPSRGPVKKGGPQKTKPAADEVVEVKPPTSFGLTLLRRATGS